jgi:hypothetical protein
MKNLIVELQVFKEDNEKLKKAQEDQLEINEMLLRSIVTKNIPKENDKEEEDKKGPLKTLLMKQKMRTDLVWGIRRIWV